LTKQEFIRILGKGFMLVNEKFRFIKAPVKTDDRGCLSLELEAKATEYRVLRNDDGQILLDPMENIPEYEQWLWRNQEALASVLRGLEQAAAGEVHYLGSFAEYAELEIED
jgi:hypothetical protein